MRHISSIINSYFSSVDWFFAFYNEVRLHFAMIYIVYFRWFFIFTVSFFRVQKTHSSLVYWYIFQHLKYSYSFFRFHTSQNSNSLSDSRIRDASYHFVKPFKINIVVTIARVRIYIYCADVFIYIDQLKSHHSK